MSILTLYLLSTLTGVNILLATLTGILVFTAFIFFIRWDMSKDKEDEEGMRDAKRAVKKASIAAILCAVLIVTTPSTKQAMLIAGGYYATNLEGIEDLPPNVVKAANKFIEQYTEVEDAENIIK